MTRAFGRASDSFFSLPGGSLFWRLHSHGSLLCCTYGRGYYLHGGISARERYQLLEKYFSEWRTRASGEKIPPPGLRPGILTLPAAVPVVCCAYETGMCTSISVSSRKGGRKIDVFLFPVPFFPRSLSLSLLALFSFFFFIRLHIHLPSGEKGINSSVWIKPILEAKRSRRNATRKKRAPRHERFNAAARNVVTGKIPR